ncbi:MAG: LacI family DNA-binding transcriptional regulator, partial [Pseudomonadota bacterium]
AVAELHYSPNQSARSLASRRSFLIGLLYDDPGRYAVPSSGYVIKLQQGLLRACKAANYDVLLHPCNYEDPDIGEQITDLIEQSRVDGLAVAPPLSNIRAVLDAIRAKDKPFVQIAPGAQTSGRLTVVTNDRDVCAEMTSFLASLGHKRIAFIKGNPGHKAVAERYLGYKDGLEANGLPYRETLVCEGDNSIGSGEECAHRLLTQKHRPTAIFACNDDMAAGVLRVAQQMGIAVPGALSVAGFDNIPLAQQIYPALTTVNQPLREMADAGAQALINQLQSRESCGDLITIRSELVLRDTTAPLTAD